MIKKISETAVSICCSGNCPVISVEENGFIKIVDDFGGVAVLTPEQAAFLPEALIKIQQK